MKKRTAILIAFCITAGTIGITGSQAEVVAESAQTEAAETELPAADAEMKTAKSAAAIQTIWLGAIKTDVSAFGKDRANELQSQIAALIEAGAAEDAPAQEETQPTFSICIRYENGDRELYIFYRANEAWYMKTADGTIYPNAKFCMDYVSFSDGEKSPDFRWKFPIPCSCRMLIWRQNIPSMEKTGTWQLSRKREWHTASQKKKPKLP